MPKKKHDAEKLYPKKYEPDESSYRDTEGMNAIEMMNYHSMRKKGFEGDESKYHATNPPGRLHPEGTEDPWKEKEGPYPEDRAPGDKD